MNNKKMMMVDEGDLDDLREMELENYDFIEDDLLNDKTTLTNLN